MRSVKLTSAIRLNLGRIVCGGVNDTLSLTDEEAFPVIFNKLGEFADDPPPRRLTRDELEVPDVVMPKPVHFYHRWRGGNWQAISDAHFKALEDAGFDGEVRVTTIDEGYEDITLRALRSAAEELPGDTPVLYAHTKGAYHHDARNTYWLGELTRDLVTGWQARVRELGSYDVAAWLWADKGVFINDGGLGISPWPHAAGTFWWARADYLRTLPYLPLLTEGTRHAAEEWIGLNSPRVIAAQCLHML